MAEDVRAFVVNHPIATAGVFAAGGGLGYGLSHHFLDFETPYAIAAGVGTGIVAVAAVSVAAGIYGDVTGFVKRIPGAVGGAILDGTSAVATPVVKAARPAVDVLGDGFDAITGQPKTTEIKDLDPDSVLARYVTSDAFVDKNGEPLFGKKADIDALRNKQQLPTRGAGDLGASSAAVPVHVIDNDIERAIIAKMSKSGSAAERAALKQQLDEAIISSHQGAAQTDATNDARFTNNDEGDTMTIESGSITLELPVPNNNNTLPPVTRGAPHGASSFTDLDTPLEKKAWLAATVSFQKPEARRLLVEAAIRESHASAMFT